jgi:hypothetical protein
MMDYAIKKRDAKTGNKRERVVVKLSRDQVQAGQWTRGAGGSTYHFFIDQVSVCGREQVFVGQRDSALRKLCPDCYAAVSRATNSAELFE